MAEVLQAIDQYSSYCTGIDRYSMMFQPWEP
jgi:hypothetical protein